MTKNVLEQLGEVQVPPTPRKLHDDVHRQLNSRLLMSQFMEFALCALPIACAVFARGVAALFLFTLTGRYDSTIMKGK